MNGVHHPLSPVPERLHLHHPAPMKPALLRRQCNEVALHTVLQGRSAPVEYAPAQQLQKVPDDAAVSAAVTLQVAGQPAHVDDFLRLAEHPDMDEVGAGVSLDLSLSAHGLKGTVAILSESAHGEADGGTILQEQVGLLVVHHIVVALVDAPTVGPLPQSPVRALYRVLHAEHGGDPAVPPSPAGLGTGDVDLLCVKGAGFLNLAAIQTA